MDRQNIPEAGVLNNRLSGYRIHDIDDKNVLTLLNGVVDSRWRIAFYPLTYSLNFKSGISGR